uniref:Uncharacterized protein n=1 Tax=Cajanus cajan TaxID=3821 RepID=A0A151RY81_CAJCA|nr:hypothetical protein KK1_030825 [Cajanus cajan]
MATIGFGFAETYVTRKLYKEKMKKRVEEEGEKNTNMKISTIESGSEDKTSSGCFSWISKQNRRKISHVSDHHDTEAANF